MHYLRLGDKDTVLEKTWNGEQIPLSSPSMCLSARPSTYLFTSYFPLSFQEYQMSP